MKEKVIKILESIEDINILFNIIEVVNMFEIMNGLFNDDLKYNIQDLIDSLKEGKVNI